MSADTISAGFRSADPTFASSDRSSRERRALLERLFQAFNRHDIEGVMACFTPRIVFEAAGGAEAYGRRFVGHKEVSEAFVAVWTAMPDVAWHVSRHTVAEDRGFSEWLFVATRADGSRIEVEGIDLFVFDGALIVSKRALRKERPLQPARERAVA